MSDSIGVDIGGTNVRAAKVTQDGQIVTSVRQRLSKNNPQAVIDLIVKLVSQLNCPENLPMAVGLAGFINSRSGVVMGSPNLGWVDVPFKTMLTDVFGRHIRLVNDLDAITFGEARCGAGRGELDVAYIFVGTGVGMGATVAGKVLEGADGLATELGHIKVESVASGRLCGCGMRGCLEAYTSGRHLPELLLELSKDGFSSDLILKNADEINKISADKIESAALAGDLACTALWDKVASYLGQAVGNLITVLNPRVVVFGGGVLLAAPTLRDKMVIQAGRCAGRHHFPGVTFRLSELGDDAGVIGAGLLAQALA